jgi:peptide-methionine (S)-S-oxide reductase
MTETATLAGGCFWCTEAVFKRLKGVESVLPGYTGGTVTNPTYKQVCSGTTGHAEAVQVKFDPSVISYEDILHVFFKLHDPTTLNRQGADVGTQYRSGIWYEDEEQKQTAERVIAEVNESKLYDSPVVTEVSPATDYYEAEDYHLDFYDQNRSYPYCRVIIDPKIEKLTREFGEKVGA